MKLKVDTSHHTYESTNVTETPYMKVKVLCWVIMTGLQNLGQMTKFIRATWTQPYTTALFMSSEESKDFPAVRLNTKKAETNYTGKQLKPFSICMTII